MPCAVAATVSLGVDGTAPAVGVAVGVGPGGDVGVDVGVDVAAAVCAGVAVCVDAGFCVPRPVAATYSDHGPARPPESTPRTAYQWLAPADRPPWL